MKVLKKPIFLASVIAIYFSVAWLFPWENFQFNSTISVSYFWDILFATTIGLLYKLPITKITFTKAIPRSIAILFLAVVSIIFIRTVGAPAPFKYLERPILQLLILAPILEEFVFRYALMGASLESINNENKAMLLGAFLFSLSHLPGVWHLPGEFHPFIYVQLTYTFFMGWVICKARVRTGGVVEPIFLHFLFNLCFYISTSKGWI